LARETIMLKRSDIAQKWTPSPRGDLNGITPQELDILFDTIDYEFFNNQIRDYLKKTKRSLSVFPSNKTTITTNGKYFGSMFRIYIDINKILTTDYTKCFTYHGFDICNPVTYLQVLLENEMAKFVSMIFCHTSDHYDLYEMILKNMFGHDVNDTFETHETPNTLKTPETNTAKTQIHTITFEPRTRVNQIKIAKLASQFDGQFEKPHTIVFPTKNQAQQVGRILSRSDAVEEVLYTDANGNTEFLKTH